MWKFIADVVHDFVSSLQRDVGRGFLRVSNVFLFYYSVSICTRMRISCERKAFGKIIIVPWSGHKYKHLEWEKCPYYCYHHQFILIIIIIIILIFATLQLEVSFFRVREIFCRTLETALYYIIISLRHHFRSSGGRMPNANDLAELAINIKDGHDRSSPNGDPAPMTSPSSSSNVTSSSRSVVIPQPTNGGQPSPKCEILHNISSMIKLRCHFLHLTKGTISLDQANILLTLIRATRVVSRNDNYNVEHTIQRCI